MKKSFLNIIDKYLVDVPSKNAIHPTQEKIYKKNFYKRFALSSGIILSLPLIIAGFKLGLDWSYFSSILISIPTWLLLAGVLVGFIEHENTQFRLNFHNNAIDAVKNKKLQCEILRSLEVLIEHYSCHENKKKLVHSIKASYEQLKAFFENNNFERQNFELVLSLIYQLRPRIISLLDNQYKDKFIVNEEPLIKYEQMFKDATKEKLNKEEIHQKLKNYL